MPRVSNTACSTATPPAKTGFRSSESPRRLSEEVLPPDTRASRNRSRDSAEIPSSDQPSAVTTAAMDLMVPELPTAVFQPALRKSSRTGRTSRAPASSAFCIPLAVMRSSSK